MSIQSTELGSKSLENIDISQQEINYIQNNITLLLQEINNSNSQHENYDKIIKNNSIDNIFQRIFGYELSYSFQELIMLQSFLYIVNRDEYKNIPTTQLRKVTTNKLIVRDEYGNPTNRRIHTDYIVHIVDGETIQIEKNNQFHTLQKINYIDPATGQNYEGGYVATQYLNPVSINEMIGFNGFMLENGIDNSIENKEILYKKISYKFENESYNPQIIEHNQAIYTYLVEKKLEAERNYDLSKALLKEMTHNNLHSLDGAFPISKLNIGNIPESCKSSTDYFNTLFQNILPENKDIIAESLQNKLIHYFSNQYTHTELNTIFSDNINNLDEHTLVREYIDYQIKKGNSTFTIYFKGNTKKASLHAYENYSGELNKYYTNNEVQKISDKNFRGFLIKELLKSIS